MVTLEKLESLHGKKISAVENVSMFLEKIKKDNPKINAFLQVNPDVLEQAEIVDKKIKSGKSGRLAGLAIAVKSNINVDGLKISCASKTLEDYYATYDADVIRKIKDEDGLIIGMANMDEFACGSSGENSAFGPTDNPSALGRIPGGSSSGSAAAVAAGMCDLALGSDTGGSVRTPASHCGVVGIKPTYGRVSRFGLVDMAMSLEQIGCLAKDVYGAALLLEVISGRSEYDPITSTSVVKPFSKFSKVSCLKIGMSSKFESLCTDKRIYAKVKEFAQHLAALTSSTIVDLPLDYVDLSIQAYYPIVYVEFFSGTRKFDGRRYGKKIEENCGEEVLRRILGGQEISKAEHHGAYYRKALAARRVISAEFDKALSKVDIMIMPTTPMLPHKLGDKIADPRAMYAYDAFTIPANLSGLCAGVLKIGEIDNIPVGLQIMAPRFSEHLLLSALSACESSIANS